jgi:ribosomal protein L35
MTSDVSSYQTKEDTEAAINARTYRDTKAYDSHILIKQEIKDKRFHRDWHWLHSTATQKLEELLNNNKNDCIQTFL